VRDGLNSVQENRIYLILYILHRI